MFFIGIMILLLAALTAFCLTAGIILLFWKKTRLLSLYLILVEPGAVGGLIFGLFVWERLFFRFVAHLLPPDQHAQAAVIALILVTLLWLGITSITAAIMGFALATWLWWHFSPEPYRPKIVNAYHRLIAGLFWHRRGGTRAENRSGKSV
jgi:hypothetical protein